ncbi:UDP-glycosyltransferase UGT5-like [Galleria mellonella]|uniref:UDP-glucuronosyltransferase n=1 Tax=Galleria mellonella TaxID=7137 RepID=A0A6J1X569_GALME|nr:UDP-glycosyltransferase UGT5-like [Galleria mellonella]
MKLTEIIFFYYCYRIIYTESAKILAVFPTQSISHQVVFRPLMHELAARGHEVVVITPAPAYPAGGGPANLTEIDVRQYYGDIVFNLSTSVNEYDNIRTSIRRSISIGEKRFPGQLNTPTVQKIIRNKNTKFDLLIVEAWFAPLLAFSHRFNVPVIRISSVGSFFPEYHVMDGFGHPLLYPPNLCSRCPNIENLTFIEKIYEIYNYIYISDLFYCFEETENVKLKAVFGSDMPSLSELSKNVHLHMSNVHRTWELNRPVPTSVIQVGGIHLKSECTLPEDLKKYLDSSVNGVLYISFGTNMKTSWLQAEKLDIMIKVLSSLPLDILWKWDEDELPVQTGNIKISKWLPQECLLRHPKVKLFITQGGLQSTEEAIAAGVPLVGIPMIADQFSNVQNYVRHRIGVKLMWNDFTEEEFRDAIYSVWKDESYRHNIIRFRDQLRDVQMQPLARAVWWTEYVLKYGGAMHLRAPAANMHWAQYHELDLLALLAAFVFLACFAVYIAIKILLRLIWRICVKKVNFNEQKLKY